VTQLIPPALNTWTDPRAAASIPAISPAGGCRAGNVPHDAKTIGYPSA